uniref:Uncharacterized protein n=1 Tax=Pygocentrus nattereri TaxID=42514 RepID=A0AAR2M0W0_PYGNA
MLNTAFSCMKWSNNRSVRTSGSLPSAELRFFTINKEFPVSVSHKPGLIKSRAVVGWRSGNRSCDWKVAGSIPRADSTRLKLEK